MTTFIFGHKNPDTDSIASAIALSYLKNKQGFDTVPKRLGEISKETEFVLNRFGIKKPGLLTDVRPQVKDLEHNDIAKVLPTESIEECKNLLNDDETALLAVVDEEDHLIGVANLKDIAVKTLRYDLDTIDTSISNLLTILKGKILNGSEDGTTSGKVVVIPHIDDFDDLYSGEIIITSSQRVAEKAATEKAKMIICTNNKPVLDEVLEISKQNNVDLIASELNIFSVARVIDRANSISTVMNEDVVSFKETDFLDDVKEVMLEIKRRDFPVVDDDGKLLGVINRNHILNPDRKKVILVDHNEYGQSVNGLKEANVIEIVDHHKIGGIMTSNPISFRNMIVGSTCTIVYSMFKESGIEIPKDIAGLLLSGVTSDTLIMRSPTTTQVDIDAIAELEKIVGVDVKEYGMEMFKAGTSLDGFTIEEIFYRDFKEFMLDDHKVGIGQVFTLDIDEIMEKKEDYIEFMKKTKEDKDYYMVLLAFTDIIKEGSYILFASDKDIIITTAFDVEDEQGVFVEELVSRKKQMVPNITQAYEIYGRE